MTVLTVYPDAGTGNTTVDGKMSRVKAFQSGEAWATIRAGAGTTSSDTTSGVLALTVEYTDDDANGTFRSLGRSGATFDTSALTSNALISAATLSLYAGNKANQNISAPAINIVSFSPASNNALVAADYSTLGSTVFSTEISYANWTLESYEDFPLNASGQAAISKTGISKFGVIESNFDLTGTIPSTNQYGVTRMAAYGADETGTTKDPKLTITYVLLDPPTVTTQAVTSITSEGGTFNGNITDIGVGNCTARGCYVAAGSVTPTSGDTVFSSSGSFGTGAYTQAMTGLDPETLYSAISFATNADGTSTGSVVEFTTLAATPTVTTQAASSIATNQAVLNGNITDLGGTDVTEWGFYYAAGDVTPTSADSVISSTGTASTGAYTETPTGLLDNQLYSAIAFATNTAGTVVGSVVTFTTASFKETVSGTTGAMSVTLTDLKPSTKYYIRSYATNSEGTSYGTETNFTTVAKPPTSAFLLFN